MPKARDGTRRTRVPQPRKAPVPAAKVEKLSGLAIGYRIYQQIAAVLGAVALAAMLSRLSGVDWRSFVADLVGYWDEYARAVVGWLLDILIETPLGWLGVNVQMPVLLQDYVAVGIILMLSTSRDMVRRGRMRQTLQERGLGRTIAALVFLGAIWPLFLLILLVSLMMRDEPIAVLLTLSPVIYLCLLLAANYLLL